MKTTYHSHLRGTNGCLGYYYGLAALQSDFPEGGLAGEFFINGETQSLWIWDTSTRSWSDTNHVSPVPFMGLIANPATFSPLLGEKETGCFIYIVGQKGTYEFPMLSGSIQVSVEAGSAGIITLVWDGTFWFSEFTPLSFDNTGSPVALFQGEWSNEKTYRCGDGFADVVRYNNKYYRLKSLVKEANMALAPDGSDEWELLPHFAAVANSLELPPDAMIELRNGQSIGSYMYEDMGYIIYDGEIIHQATGVRLDCEGKIRIPMQDGSGEIVISPDPDDNGIRIYSNNDDANEVITLGFDEDFLPRLEFNTAEGTAGYKLHLNPNLIYIAEKADKNREYTRFYVSPTELNATLKYETDELNPGDLYYDADLYVRYCE